MNTVLRKQLHRFINGLRFGFRYPNAMDIQRIERSIYYHASRHTLGLSGDYLEFGVFRGHSLAYAYEMDCYTYRLHSKVWPSTKPHTGRYFGFDSFQGLPEPEGLDSGGPFRKSAYCAGEDVVLERLKRKRVDLKRVHLLKGWFEDTCCNATVEKYALEKARVVHIDCDLYSSTCTALNFITSMVQTGTILIFDDYFHFHGDTRRGEMAAFNEWLSSNGHLIATEWMREYPWRNSFILTDTSDGLSIKPEQDL